MKGKLFIIFVMVGIPAMAWAFLAWVIMLLLGALHSVFSMVPALSFWASLVSVIMVFTIIIIGASMATDNTTPARRHDGR